MNSPPSSDYDLARIIEEMNQRLEELDRKINEVHKKICKPPKKQAEWRNYAEQCMAMVNEQQFMLPRDFIEISNCSYGDWSRFRNYAKKRNPDLAESPMQGSNQIILHYRAFDISSIQAKIVDLSKEPASSHLVMKRLVDCINKAQPPEYVKEYGFNVQRYLSDSIYTRSESQGTRERAHN
ncbi:MAG: hypothetical protein AB9860_05940 [Methanomassiliicoccales archaeon]